MHYTHTSKHLECGSALVKDLGLLTPVHSMKTPMGREGKGLTCLWLKAEWGLETKAL